MRKPKVENKHNIKPDDVKNFKVLNKEALKEYPFWRNDIIQAWCLSGNTIKSREDDKYGCYSEYWIGFYDEDAKQYPGQIRLDCSAFGGMCSYTFKEFLMKVKPSARQI